MPLERVKRIYQAGVARRKKARDAGDHVDERVSPQG